MYIYRARHHTNTRLLTHIYIKYICIYTIYIYIFVYTCIHIYPRTYLFFLFQALVEYGDFLPLFKGVSTQFWAETHELKAAHDRGTMRTPPTTPRTYAMPGSASGQLEQCSARGFSRGNSGTPVSPRRVSPVSSPRFSSPLGMYRTSLSLSLSL